MTLNSTRCYFYQLLTSIFFPLEPLDDIANVKKQVSGLQVLKKFIYPLPGYMFVSYIFEHKRVLIRKRRIDYIFN